MVNLKRQEELEKMSKLQTLHITVSIISMVLWTLGVTALLIWLVVYAVRIWMRGDDRRYKGSDSTTRLDGKVVAITGERNLKHVKYY